MLQVRTSSAAGTRAVAAALAGLARCGDIIDHAGDMGAGKTAFAQGFGAALGVGQPITSPTFNLVHSYPLDRLTFHHADLYRLGTQHELDDLALGELADDRGIVVVEWGDVVDGAFGEHLTVHLDVLAVDEADDEADDEDAAAAGADRAGDHEAAGGGPTSGRRAVGDEDAAGHDAADDGAADDGAADDDVEQARTITFHATGPAWALRWDALARALTAVPPC
jgi:tRNA threonylcarbamoyladenosine biosynthesis protein TsaE